MKVELTLEEVRVLDAAIEYIKRHNTLTDFPPNLFALKGRQGESNRTNPCHLFPMGHHALFAYTLKCTHSKFGTP